MIKVNNLSFSYPNNKDKFIFPNFSLQKSESLLVLGSSGVGKTTFLHLIAGLLTPISGSIVMNQVSITDLNKTELTKFRGKNIGLVFQTPQMIKTLTILENLKARLFFSNKIASDQHINELLQHLAILDLKKNYPLQLSQGQLQRVGIALSLVHEPKFILADEPTSSLDDVNTQKVINLLKTQAKAIQANLIIITHDQRLKKQFDNQLCLS